MDQPLAWIVGIAITLLAQAGGQFWALQRYVGNRIGVEARAINTSFEAHAKAIESTMDTMGKELHGLRSDMAEAVKAITEDGNDIKWIKERLGYLETKVNALERGRGA